MSARRDVARIWLALAFRHLDVAEAADRTMGLLPGRHVALEDLAATSEIEALECLIEAARHAGLGGRHVRRVLTVALMGADWGLDPGRARRMVRRTARLLFREER